MKKIELKNCPNCNERIGVQDIECPYCKYIDDPKYKKYNEKLKKNNLKNKTKKKKNNVYKQLLLIPILMYLGYLAFDLSMLKIIIPLILLNILCFFTKKTLVFGVMILEIIVLLFKFISSVHDMYLTNSFKDIKVEIVIFILGILFVVMPKFMYILKSNKKRRKVRKK